MKSSPDWWASARLSLQATAAGGRPLEIGYGSLAEVVALALSRPEGERSLLYIQTEPAGEKLNWLDIAALAARPDCPLII